MSDRPIDLDELAALADEWLNRPMVADEMEPTLIALLQSVATLSRTAGRAEGLEEAAKVYDERAASAAISEAQTTEDRAVGSPFWRSRVVTYEEVAKTLRALASDPAPGEPIFDSSTTPGARTIDGRIIEAPAHSVEPAPGEQVDHFAGVRKMVAPAHPTEPGEVERLGALHDWAIADHDRVVAELSAIKTEVERLRVALVKIDAIRNSIVGFQKINWSEHIYPLVAALNEAGFPGEEYEVARENVGTLIEQIKAADAEIERLLAIETAAREVVLQKIGEEDWEPLLRALSTPDPVARRASGAGSSSR